MIKVIEKQHFCNLLQIFFCGLLTGDEKYVKIKESSSDDDLGTTTTVAVASSARNGEARYSFHDRSLPLEYF
jgi:hypothetical protein